MKVRSTKVDEQSGKMEKRHQRALVDEQGGKMDVRHQSVDQKIESGPVITC